MDHVRLGSCGLKVSKLILGTMGMGDKSWRDWVLDEAESFKILEKAVEVGITTFDTCDFYSGGESERILGKFIKQQLTRDDVVIATKVGMPMGPSPNGKGFSRKHIQKAVDSSLQRLQTDYIDLYQTHIWDPRTNIEELITVFDDLIRQGKILYAGATDMPAWQFSKALFKADLMGCSRFVSMQNHFNLIFREDERELIPLCHDQGIGWIPYSPMARGFLCGNRSKKTWGKTVRSRTDDFAQKNYFRDADFEVEKAVKIVADKYKVSPAQISLAWVMQQPTLTAAVIGATKHNQIQLAVDALDISIHEEDIKLLKASYEYRAPAAHS